MVQPSPVQPRRAPSYTRSSRDARTSSSCKPVPGDSARIGFGSPAARTSGRPLKLLRVSDQVHLAIVGRVDAELFGHAPGGQIRRGAGRARRSVDDEVFVFTHVMTRSRGRRVLCAVARTKPGRSWCAGAALVGISRKSAPGRDRSGEDEGDEDEERAPGRGAPGQTEAEELAQRREIPATVLPIDDSLVVRGFSLVPSDDAEASYHRFRGGDVTNLAGPRTRAVKIRRKRLTRSSRASRVAIQLVTGLHRKCLVEPGEIARGPVRAKLGRRVRDSRARSVAGIPDASSCARSAPSR